MNSKQKNIALIIGFVLMLLISYRFSFSKTIEAKGRVEKLAKDKALLENAEANIRSLQMEEKYLDSILQSNDLSIENTFQQTLLIKITQFTNQHNLKLISSNEPHSFISEGTKLLTYEIEAQGSFRDLMLFSNYIEQQRLAKLASLTFLKKKNYRTRRDYLRCKIVLQRFSK
jgi:hypothetical protein